MVGFKVLSTMGEIELKRLPISSQTLSVGDMIDRSLGATTWAASTANTKHFTRKAICYAAATSSDTFVLAYELRGDEEVEAQSNATANADHNGDLMILTDKNTVANTGTTVTSEEPVFIQDRVGSTTTSIIGRVIVGSGVDPDQTG